MCEINRNLNFEICIIGIVWQLDWARTRVLHFYYRTKQNKGELVGERGVREGGGAKGSSRVGAACSGTQSNSCCSNSVALCIQYEIALLCTRERE